jgi:hypothetical protein
MPSEDCRTRAIGATLQRGRFECVKGVSIDRGEDGTFVIAHATHMQNVGLFLKIVQVPPINGVR